VKDLIHFNTCQAVIFMHNLGIYHCDIAPRNVLFSPAEGCIKLIDFDQSVICGDYDPELEWDDFNACAATFTYWVQQAPFFFCIY